MPAVAERPAPPVAKPVADPGGSVVLYDVPWSLYVALRDRETAENHHVRMTYDRGCLELMSPQTRHHELPHKLLSHFVVVWALERNIAFSTCGTTTLRRKDLKRGAEPDESFHIQHEADVRAVKDLKLPENPPPDLVIESDYTSSSIPRLPIFAALGVPEVWRWCAGKLQVYCLEADEYAECEESRVLPGFPLDEVRHLMAARYENSEMDLLREFRDIARSMIDGKPNG